MYYASGTSIHKFPDDGIVLGAELEDQGAEVCYFCYNEIGNPFGYIIGIF